MSGQLLSLASGNYLASPSAEFVKGGHPEEGTTGTHEQAHWRMCAAGFR
jgi:hypothetical protein